MLGQCWVTIVPLDTLISSHIHYSLLKIPSTCRQNPINPSAKNPIKIQNSTFYLLELTLFWHVSKLTTLFFSVFIINIHLNLPIFSRSPYGTLHQPRRGLEGGQVNLPSGRVLGGSTAINYMAYVRGSPKDYDLWATLGADGWSWKEVWEPGRGATTVKQLKRKSMEHRR